MNNDLERLQKVIANSGVCSRRKAKLLIINGQVTVNGQIITTLGFKVTSSDIIKVNNQIIQQSNHIYFLIFTKNLDITFNFKLKVIFLYQG